MQLGRVLALPAAHVARAIGPAGSSVARRAHPPPPTHCAVCKFLRAVGNVMVLFVLGIVGFTWYGVVPARFALTVARGGPLAAAGAALLVAGFTLLVRRALGGGRCGGGARATARCRARGAPARATHAAGRGSPLVRGQCAPLPRAPSQPPPLPLAAAVPAAAAPAQVAMVVWSYFAAVLTDPGRVPDGWSPFPDEQARLGRDWGQRFAARGGGTRRQGA
jgi:hypothetical protein